MVSASFPQRREPSTSDCWICLWLRVQLPRKLTDATSEAVVPVESVTVN